MQKFIESIRKELTSLWDRCYFGEEQRRLFDSFYSGFYAFYIYCFKLKFLILSFFSFFFPPCQKCDLVILFFAFPSLSYILRSVHFIYIFD